MEYGRRIDQRPAVKSFAELGSKQHLCYVLRIDFPIDKDCKKSN